MKSVISISTMKPGDTGIIASVNCKDSIRTRLSEIGFIKNETIECMLISPFKDPIAYLVNGTIIALRKEDCKDIMVLPIKKENDYGAD